jgi:hypothetical protein
VGDAESPAIGKMQDISREEEERYCLSHNMAAVKSLKFRLLLEKWGVLFMRVGLMKPQIIIW